MDHSCCVQCGKHPGHAHGDAKKRLGRTTELGSVANSQKMWWGQVPTICPKFYLKSKAQLPKAPNSTRRRNLDQNLPAAMQPAAIYNGMAPKALKYS